MNILSIGCCPYYLSDFISKELTLWFLFLWNFKYAGRLCIYSASLKLWPEIENYWSDRLSHVSTTFHTNKMFPCKLYWSCSVNSYHFILIDPLLSYWCVSCQLSINWCLSNFPFGAGCDQPCLYYNILGWIGVKQLWWCWKQIDSICS